MERSRRRKSTHVSDAIARLKEEREGGVGSRVKGFSVKEEDKVYEVVDEDNYAKIVEKRRQESGKEGSFVVNDDGLGYMDVGEEDWFGSEEPVAVGRRMDAALSKKGPMTKKRGPNDDGRQAKRQALSPPDPQAKKRMQQMFSKAAVRPSGASKASNESSDALLESILSGIQKSGPSVAPIPKTRVPVKAKNPSPYPSVSEKPAHPMPPSVLKPSKQDLECAQPGPSQDDFTFDVPQGGADVDCGGGLMALACLIEEDEQQAGKGEASYTARPQANEEDALGDSGPPSPTSIPDVNKLSISTPSEEISTVPKRSFRAPQPQSFAPVSGWQEIQGIQEGPGDNAEEVPWKDDGTLPLTDSGTLPFFLIDALEEVMSPGVLYLFGKVPCKNSHQFVSCCSIVKDLDRILYVTPKPNIFSPDDSELSRLESEVAKDPGNKMQLMKYLQNCAEPVKQEVRAHLLKAGVKKFRMKPVKRKYAFEEQCVSHGEQYVLKIYCPGAGTLPLLGLTGETFTYIFGQNQSLLELLLLKRKIMGPSWIGLKKPTKKEQHMQRSWCSIEVELSGHKSIVRTPSPEWAAKPAPELKIAAINLKTYVNPNTQTNEVVVASVVHVDSIKCDGPTDKAQWNSRIKHFSGVTKLRSQPWPPGFEGSVQKQNESHVGRRNGGNVCKQLPSERALLNYFLTRLRAIDPDVLVGHNIAAFDLSVLLHRMLINKVDQWSRLGRLKRQKYPSLSGGGQVFGGGAGQGVMAALAGRLLCDTYLSARELVKEVDYTLTTLSKSLLGEFRNGLSVSDVPNMYGTCEGVLSLIQHTESDAYLSMGLVFQLSVLPLTKQLTNLSGSLWNKTLQGQRAQRIEMLLLHEFHSRKYLLPDKLSTKERVAKARAEGREDDAAATLSKGKKKAQYAGGLVLEPKKGLYDKFVLLLDFNSLYPSIIQEYNICFTTVARPKNTEDETAIAELPEASRDLAPLPTVIRNLVQRRKQAKTLMANTKDPTQKQQLNIRQQALKLTANSMYGCLGFVNSRFFCKPLAELITSQGREILQSTVDLVQGKLGLEVVYGDTDSIMINTGKGSIDEVIQLGMAVKKEVNKHYRLLEIDIDGVFKSLLLLKKKKYAAVKVEVLGNGQLKEEMEQKGLDIVRRDWCPLSKVVGNFALKEILSGKPKEDVVMAIHEHLREVKDKVLAGDVDLGQYLITKQLTKAPEDYPDAKSQAHVQVAIRRKKQGKREGVMQGETVPYAICIMKDAPDAVGDTKSLANRAFHPEEVVSNGMEVDKMYYLAHQVHPSVSRLCAPIEGTDEARIADCLGLDPSKFRHRTQANAPGDILATPSGFMDDEERYKDCEPLTLMAPDGSTFPFCGVTSVLKGLVALEDALAPPHAVGSLSQRLPPGTLANQATLLARRFVTQYYDAWLKPDDDSSMHPTRDVALRPHSETGDQDINSHSRSSIKRVLNEKQLYLQLSHFHRLLDAPGACTRLSIDHNEAVRVLGGMEGVSAMQTAAQAVAQLRDLCQFRWVSLGKMFC